MAERDVVKKIKSNLKEELWGRIGPGNIGIKKFSILDDIFNELVADDLFAEALDICRVHKTDHPESIASSYLIGIIGYHKGNLDDAKQLRSLIEVFVENHKWSIVELISEKILEYGESSMALRALATCLERQGRNREAIPVWENLLKIERFDAEVAKKLALAIIEDDIEKSVHFMKLSIEGFIKNRDYDEIPSLWNKLISVSKSDHQFFDRIERMLIDAKKFDLTAGLLKTLLNSYDKLEDNIDSSIDILKKILAYRPLDTHARRELIRLYEAKYGGHSHFDQFKKLSQLDNFKIPVKLAIQDFEKNIVFDNGNYVYHSSWKLGKITGIDTESLLMSFDGRDEHKMSIRMALQSLTPLPKDHLYVFESEDPESLKTMFNEDFMLFFEILIKSYGGTIVLADIKREITSRYISEKAWSKWWNRVRMQIKKDPLYGVDSNKRDLFFMRDRPITFADELLGNFTKSDSFSEKLNITMEFINNNDREEGAPVVQYFVDYFTQELRGDSLTRQLLSFFILNDLEYFLEPGKLKLEAVKSRILSVIRDSSELPFISMKISSYDYKKDFIKLIEEVREDWPVIVSEIMFEVPVRIHKYIFNMLIQHHEYNRINNFIDLVITGAKQSPEVFLWTARNIFTRSWNYDWLDYSAEQLITSYFRLMRELKKIEISGNRLKNQALDILLNNNSEVISEIIASHNRDFIGKIYDIFTDLPFVEDSHRKIFMDSIKEKFPDFSIDSEAHGEDTLSFDSEKLITTREGFEKKKERLEKMINAELPEISRELAEIAEVTSDIRENSDYSAIMEKQTILELSISKLDSEMKKADILNPDAVSTDKVNVGTKIELKDTSSSETHVYTILGPWDADFEKGILSYRSPLARSLMGSVAGETVKVLIGDAESTYEIVSIRKFNQ